MDISIVIVNYNTRRILDECIASVKQETSCSYEIIVVDNASVDDSRLMLREKYPDVILIENNENAGFARANNQGFAIARGNYFFMLNSDTVVLDGAIDKLVDFMERNQDVGICGPRNIGSNGELQFNCDHFPGLWNTFCSYSGLNRLFPRSRLFNRGRMRYWDYEGVRDVDRMVGCSLMVRSGLYRRLGGLDEKFFMYFEETDLCCRARRKGLRVTYVPHASIIHYGGESSKNGGNQVVIEKTVSSYFYTSQYYYFTKHYGIFSMLAIRCLDFTYGFLLLARNYRRKDAVKRGPYMRLGMFLVKKAVGCD